MNLGWSSPRICSKQEDVTAAADENGWKWVEKRPLLFLLLSLLYTILTSSNAFILCPRRKINSNSDKRFSALQIRHFLLISGLDFILSEIVYDTIRCLQYVHLSSEKSAKSVAIGRPPVNSGKS
jgi:hypothetical protein